MSTTTLHLVRHGEASIDGTSDPTLTSLGARQAESVGIALRSAGADVVLHGTRRRSIETASTIAGAVTSTRTEHSDLFEDRTPIPHDWNEVPTRHHAALRQVPSEQADPGARRLTDAVDEMGRLTTHDRTIIAVTHNFVIGWFVRSVLESPWWRWIGLNLDNGAITTIRWSSDREPRLLCFNERGHLPDA